MLPKLRAILEKNTVCIYFAVLQYFYFKSHVLYYYELVVGMI